MRKVTSRSISVFVTVQMMMHTALLAQTRPTLKSPKDQIRFFSESSARLSYGVCIPANRKLYIISGIVPEVLDSMATGRNRFGDTKQQAINVLEKISKQLHAQGLSIKDVVYLRAFVGPDPVKNSTFDFAGWNAAYDLYFNNTKNPIKPGRATLGAQLVSPDFLIELEGLAVYPE